MSHRFRKLELFQVGKAIKQVREFRGLSQYNLCSKMSAKSKSFLSRIENGRNLPSLQTIIDISKALQIRPHKLIHLAERITIEQRKASR
jgi:transcriptional regulator with XRE-family HTH domain